MIVKKGDWIGKGSVLVDGATLGVGLELALKIVEDEDGFTLTGDLSGAGQGPISIRIAPNDVGTYVIDARILTAALDGIAKLESEPNLALVVERGANSVRHHGAVSCRHWHWRAVVSFAKTTTQLPGKC